MSSIASAKSSDLATIQWTTRGSIGDLKDPLVAPKVALMVARRHQRPQQAWARAPAIQEHSPTRARGCLRSRFLVSRLPTGGAW
jgi:hypothetical protein